MVIEEPAKPNMHISPALCTHSKLAVEPYQSRWPGGWPITDQSTAPQLPAAPRGDCSSGTPWWPGLTGNARTRVGGGLGGGAPFLGSPAGGRDYDHRVHCPRRAGTPVSDASLRSAFADCSENQRLFILRYCILLLPNTTLGKFRMLCECVSD